MKTTDKINILNKDYEHLLGYLKALYPVFHNSNLFFRDFQYGIKRYLDSKQMITTYADAEKIAEHLGRDMEQKGVFVRVNTSGWRINYPAFVTTAPGDPL